MGKIITIIPTEAGGAEVSWRTAPSESELEGYVSIMADGSLCVPFWRNNEPYVFVLGDGAYIAHSEGYPPLPEDERVWSA